MGYDFLFKSIGRYIILPLLQEFVWNIDNCHVANLVLKMDQNTVLLNVYFVQYTHYYYHYQTLHSELFLRQIMNKQLEHIHLCPWELIDLEVSNLEFVVVFLKAQLKKIKTNIQIRHVQIDELPNIY